MDSSFYSLQNVHQPESRVETMRWGRCASIKNPDTPLAGHFPICLFMSTLYASFTPCSETQELVLSGCFGRHPWPLATSWVWSVGSIGWRMARKRNTRSGHVFPSLPLPTPVWHLSLYRNSFSEFQDPLPLLAPWGLLVVMAPSSIVSV